MEALKNESTVKKLSEYVKQHLETNESQTIEQKWSACTETLRTAAENILGTKHNNSKDWFDEECREAIRKKNQEYFMQTRKTRASLGKHKKLRRIEKQIH